MNRCAACGWDRDEFPDVEHPTDDDCAGPECTCYEVFGLGHMMGCPFYARPPRQRSTLPTEATSAASGRQKGTP